MTDQPKPETQCEVATDSRMTDQPKPETQSEVSTDNKMTDQPMPETQCQVATDSRMTDQPKPETQSEVATNNKMTDQPKSETQCEVATDSRMTDQPKPETQSEVATDSSKTDQPKAEIQSEVATDSRKTDQPKPETQSEVATDSRKTDQYNPGSRDLARMVREGQEENVVAFLASAGRNTEEWQEQLVGCVVAAINHKRPGIIKHLVESGADLSPLYSSKPLLCDVFRGCDPTTRNIFQKDLFKAAVNSRNLEFVERAWSMMQKLSKELVGEHHLVFPVHMLVDFHPENCPDTRLTAQLKEILDFLLNKGFDINGTDPTKSTPLHMAVERGNMAGIRALLTLGADPFVQNERGEYPYTIACLNNHYDIMKELLEGVAFGEHRERFESLLHEACYHGWEPAVRYLLDRGVDVNCTDAENRTPLFIAVWLTNIDIVQCLVTHSLCDVNFDGGAAMRCAWHYVYIDDDIPSHLIEIDWDETKIQLKCFCSTVEPIIRLLVQAGASPNLPDEKGHTLLMDSQLIRERPYREYMLAVGADVNAVAGDGRSVLWTAVCEDAFPSSFVGDNPDNRYPQVFVLLDLLAQNIDIGVSKHQHEGMTPLHLAFYGYRHEFCNILLDSDCSLNGMSEYLSSIQEQRLCKGLQEVRARILAMCNVPYSLKAQARLAVLRAIGQGDLLRGSLHRLHQSRLLPKALVHYLGKSINFNMDNVCLAL